jgi:small-conductance mechanosensitive channel
VFSTSIFVNLARLLIVVMGAIIVLDSFGVSVTHIITVMGLGGLAVALALQPTLATFFSGLQILASKQVRVGDFVKLDTGEDGYVQDITWRVTTLRTLSNNLVFIPNAKLSAAVLTNYSLPDKGVDLRVQVCMNTTTDHFAVEKEALAIAREITKEAQGDIPGFEPYVHYNAITETSTNFIVVLRVREYSDMYRMRDKFIRKLTERLEKEGVFKSVMTVDKVV